MKGFIQEYGLILVGVAAMLLCLLFGKQIFNQDITNSTVDNVVELRDDKDEVGALDLNSSEAVTKKYDKISKTYTFTTEGEGSGAEASWQGSGASMNLSENIPYGKWYVIEFEVKASLDCDLCIDYNNKTVDVEAWNGNDNDNYSTRTPSSIPLKKDEWKKVYVYYQNSSDKNKIKAELKDYSHLGIYYSKDKGNQSFQIRNLQSYVAANPPRNVNN